MAYRVTLLPGDGIGPEVAGATVRVLEATGVKFQWEKYEVGESALRKYNTPSPVLFWTPSGRIKSLSRVP